MEFQTQDRLKIYGRHFTTRPDQPGHTLIIAAPGFAQHSHTRSMQAVANSLLSLADVLILDFRGTGQSQGRYSFGAKEYLDFEPILVWARSGYDKIAVLGFSLGAYSSLRAARAFPGMIDQLFLVSCPTCVEEIVTSGGALLNPCVIPFRRTAYAIRPQQDLFFHWAWPFYSKPNLAELAPTLRLAAHFLVGTRDTLVFNHLSRKVHDCYAGAKTWTSLKGGWHAEHIALQYPEIFRNWMAAGLTSDLSPMQDL